MLLLYKSVSCKDGWKIFTFFLLKAGHTLTGTYCPGHGGAGIWQNQDAFASFITSSPEQRYLNLLNERPDLVQRVPQRLLANYLGMTPELLSRIAAAKD